MADIDIEREGRGPSLWIAAALLALALFIGWILISNPAGDATDGELDGNSSPTAAASDTGRVERSFAREVNISLPHAA